MTTYREFEFSDDEWVFPNGVLSFDLTLVLSADPERNIIKGIRLEVVRHSRPIAFGIRTPEREVPIWLSDAMTAWVRDNQPKLETVRREHFAEAAE